MIASVIALINIEILFLSTVQTIEVFTFMPMVLNLKQIFTLTCCRNAVMNFVLINYTPQQLQLLVKPCQPDHTIMTHKLKPRSLCIIIRWNNKPLLNV